MFFRPDFRQENKLWKSGLVRVAGLDEAGRGAWAGPVVAAAVVFPPGVKMRGLQDSKRLAAEKRERLFVQIKKNAFSVGVGVVPHEVIDAKGIIYATREAFLKAIENAGLGLEYLLVDGLKIFEHSLPQKFIIKGDGKISSIAAASIIAKVTRDNILGELHKEFPEYGFDQHKGYGTRLHRERVDKYGISPIHRKSFSPMLENIDE